MSETIGFLNIFHKFITILFTIGYNGFACVSLRWFAQLETEWMAYLCSKQNGSKMEFSELSLKRLEGVNERLIAVVIKCAVRCPFPFNVAEGLQSEEKQLYYR